MPLHQPLPTPGASRPSFVGGVFPVARAMSSLLVAVGAAPACAARFGLHPVVAEAFCPHSGCSEQSCPVHFSSLLWGMWDSALSSSSSSCPGLSAGRGIGVRFLFQTVIVGSYLIAHGFFSVYGMCVDTLFLCFCEYQQKTLSPISLTPRASSLAVRSQSRGPSLWFSPAFSFPDSSPAFSPAVPCLLQQRPPACHGLLHLSLCFGALGSVELTTANLDFPFFSSLFSFFSTPPVSLVTRSPSSTSALSLPASSTAFRSSPSLLLLPGAGKGEDLERNDGSPERPYYMSPELSEILLKGHLEPSKSADSQG